MRKKAAPGWTAGAAQPEPLGAPENRRLPVAGQAAAHPPPARPEERPALATGSPQPQLSVEPAQQSGPLTSRRWVARPAPSVPTAAGVMLDPVAAALVMRRGEAVSIEKGVA